MTLIKKVRKNLYNLNKYNNNRAVISKIKNLNIFNKLKF